MSIPFFNKFIGFKNTPIFYIRKSRFSTFNFKFWSSCFRSNKQKIRSKILNFIHFNKSCPKIGWIFNLNQFYRESSLIKPNNIHKLYRIGNNWWISKRRNDFYSCQPSYLFIFKNTIFIWSIGIKSIHISNFNQHSLYSGMLSFFFFSFICWDFLFWQVIKIIC